MFERELNTLPLTVQVAYRKVASDRRSQGLGLRRLPKIMGLKPPRFRGTFNQKEALKIAGLFLRYT